jgi:hypothetical protein
MLVIINAYCNFNACSIRHNCYAVSLQTVSAVYRRNSRTRSCSQLSTRPWRRMGERMHRSTLPWRRHSLLVSDQPHGPDLFPWIEPPYILDTRLNEPQKRSRWLENILDPAGTRTENPRLHSP